MGGTLSALPSPMETPCDTRSPIRYLYQLRRYTCEIWEQRTWLENQSFNHIWGSGSLSATDRGHRWARISASARVRACVSRPKRQAGAEVRMGDGAVRFQLGGPDHSVHLHQTAEVELIWPQSSVTMVRNPSHKTMHVSPRLCVDDGRQQADGG